MAETFDIGVFQKNLKSQCIGKKIIYNDVTGSTMDDARKFGINDAVTCPHGTVVLAERQTKARGARDHKWDASNTGNIYTSIILHLPQTYKTFEGRFEVEVAACMAVFAVVSRLGMGVTPKWPNDLWLRGHKLAGFLVEDGQFDIPNSNRCLMVLGMGINVNADVRRNDELYSIATSLVCERGGRPVVREEFLSDVCLALEEALVSRTRNISMYRTHNLFQLGCHLSVTCAAENRVIDGEFVEVCDNWDIKFNDKRTGQLLRGRSDYYTVRPKVFRKILVVFTGHASTKASGGLARRLAAAVDTSKWLVCAVPETSVSQNDDWMASCDLLVLSEDVCDSVRLTSKLSQYLKRGGNLMTSGVASYFAAKIFEIPYKEAVFQSIAGSYASIASVEYHGLEQHGQEVSGGHCGNATSPSPARSQCVTFPTTPIHFKFSQSYKMKSSPSPSIADENGKSSDGSASDRRDLSLRYHTVGTEEKARECCVAVMTKTTNQGGSIAVVGFDLGCDRLPPFQSTQDADRECEGTGSGQGDERVRYEEFVKVLYGDRFKRDQLISRVLKVLNIT